jgi:hypothetical protein
MAWFRTGSKSDQKSECDHKWRRVNSPLRNWLNVNDLLRWSGERHFWGGDCQQTLALTVLVAVNNDNRTVLSATTARNRRATARAI